MQWEDQDWKQTTRSTFAAFFVIVVFCSGVPLSALPSDMVATTLANPLALTFREFKTLKAWGMPNEVSGDPYSRAIEWNTVQSEMYVVWLDSDQYETIRNKRGYICWTWLRKSLLPAVPNPKGPKAQGLTSPELFPSSFLILKYKLIYGIFFKLFLAVLVSGRKHNQMGSNSIYIKCIRVRTCSYWIFSVGKRRCRGCGARALCKRVASRNRKNVSVDQEAMVWKRCSLSVSPVNFGVAFLIQEECSCSNESFEVLFYHAGSKRTWKKWATSQHFQNRAHTLLLHRSKFVIVLDHR